jgi:hypothetical protein
VNPIKGKGHARWLHGPNNRALTTGGDDPKGGEILKITFAGLLSCSVEMSCEKSATVQTELPPKSDTLYGAVDLTRAQVPCTPVVADSGRAAYTARLFHFNEWTCISQNFNDQRARAAQRKGPGGFRSTELPLTQV